MVVPVKNGLSTGVLNAICPYFTMFPLEFPLGVLPARGKGVVADPFCGRGTTNLAARMRGFRTVGVDSSPVAIAATSAKVPRGNVTDRQVVGLARHLLRSRRGVSPPTGRFWKLAYHPKVLEKLCLLREGLREDRSDAGRVLRALLLGALHGPMRKDGSSTYFSNQSPRTFGPKPKYAVRYWTDNGLRPPMVDVMDIIGLRAEKLLSESIPSVRARIALADSRTVQWNKLVGDLGAINWIVTSPPYYGLTTYRPDQWLREWLLGGPPYVEYALKDQLSHSSRESFATDLGTVFERMIPYCSKSARMVLRFGSINDRPVDALALTKSALRDGGWKIDTVKSAGFASAGKRQLEAFATTNRPARSEYDIWCSLA